MDHRLLEVCIMSASDLKDIRHWSKMETYAVALMPPYVEYTTHVDRKGGTNPVWNEKFSFMMPDEVLKQRDANMTVQIFSEGMLGDSKLVGSVSIPLSDIRRLTPEEIARSGGDVHQIKSYPVKTATGYYEGDLHVSFSLGEKIPLKTSLKPGDGGLAYPIWGYQVAGAPQSDQPPAAPSPQQPPPAYARPTILGAPPVAAPPPLYGPPLRPSTRPPAPPVPTFDSSSRRPLSPGIRRPPPSAVTGLFSSAGGKILLTELISD